MKYNSVKIDADDTKEQDIPFGAKATFSDGKTYPTRLLRIKDVLRMIPVSHATIYVWMREGKFPKPVKLGPQSVAWYEDDILDWLRERMTAAA